MAPVTRPASGPQAESASARHGQPVERLLVTARLAGEAIAHALPG